ncbi:MAG: 50S ribosomal protein L20 [Chlamydiia bacterium]
MVRATNAVASHRRKKRMFRLAKGFVGDRKNHLKLTANCVMTALANNYKHRKCKKRDFRRIWTVRINAGARINGISYSRLIHGLDLAGILLNRKMLADMCVSDPVAFASVVEQAKAALAS